MTKCPKCGNAPENLRPYTTKPPRSHPGRPCDASCIIAGFLCLNCRMFLRQTR